MSRLDNAKRNIKYGYVGMIIQLVLGFISRTVFIHSLGVTFLGVNGLYTNILTVLSLAELGIGTAMNYSLYKPVAVRDLEMIKALMDLYKRFYRIVALVVSVMGLLLVPFLKYIIKDPGAISIYDLTIFYLIFLFNTVSTYFVAYKYSLVNAEQKRYIQTNIQAITTSITLLAQIIILVVLKDFLMYLVTGAIIGLIQKIGVNIYLNRLYPYLLDKNVIDLTQEEKLPIKKNISALIYLKFGEISLNQTDNIIISSFINVTTVGLVSNYNLLISTIRGFVDIVFSSVIPGFGNLIATETKEKQYFLFKVYRFVAFWIYGFASIGFTILSTPFIQLWIGNKMVVSSTVIYLIGILYYLGGHSIVVNNIRNAAGIFDAVKYLAIIFAIINLVISIVMVKLIGLEGVFIGTLCVALVQEFTIPVIVYRSVFNKSSLEYYKDSIFYFLVMCIALILVELLKCKFFAENTFINFIGLMFFVAVISNIIFYIFCRKREEFSYILMLLKIKLHRG